VPGYHRAESHSWQSPSIAGDFIGEIMDATVDLDDVVKAIVVLFVILNPIGGIACFKA